MRIELKLFIVFLFILSTTCELEQVVSFFRYPLNSLYDGNHDTKHIWGELTSVGMRQHQTLGEILRQ